MQRIYCSILSTLHTNDTASADMIHAAPSAREIETGAVALGMVPLTDHALALARRGEIALQEAYSVRLK